jgi:sugar (pentulose or hexulose) kinase
VQYHADASGALGIALLAGYALGAFAGFDVVKWGWLAHPEVAQPDSTASAVYRRLYEVYLRLDDALEPLFGNL